MKPLEPIPVPAPDVRGIKLKYRAFLTRPKIKVYTNEPIRFIQEKMDGHYVTIHKGHVRTAVFPRKSMISIHKLLERCPQVCAILRRIPKESIVLAELYSPNHPATSVKTLINSGSEDLTLSVFAAPLLDGFMGDHEDRDHEYGDTHWPTVRKSLKALDIPTPKQLYVMAEVKRYLKDPTVLPPSYIEYLKQRARDLGLEGYVAKTSHMTGWYKIKPIRSIDALVTNYTISTSDSFKGGIQSLEFSLFGIKPNGKQGWIPIADVGSGYTAEFRMNSAPDELIGLVGEISYDSIAAQGRLKFPRFERWHPDKKASECLISQVESDTTDIQT